MESNSDETSCGSDVEGEHISTDSEYESDECLDEVTESEEQESDEETSDEDSSEAESDD